MAHVIVETKLENPLTEAELAERKRRLSMCIQSDDTRWVQSYLSKDRRRMICRYEAADSETVRMVHRTAGVAFRRVWTAEILEPDSAAEVVAGS